MTISNKRCFGNKRCFLIAKIKRDTYLSIKEVENLVKDIPTKHLDEAIIIYNNNGLDLLKEWKGGIIN